MLNSISKTMPCIIKNMSPSSCHSVNVLRQRRTLHIRKSVNFSTDSSDNHTSTTPSVTKVPSSPERVGGPQTTPSSETSSRPPKPTTLNSKRISKTDKPVDKPKTPTTTTTSTTTTNNNNVRLLKSLAIKPPWGTRSLVEEKSNKLTTVATSRPAKAATPNSLPILNTDKLVGETKHTNYIRLPKSSAIKPPWELTAWQGRSVGYVKNTAIKATSNPSKATTLNSLLISKTDESVDKPKTLTNSKNVRLPKSSAIKPPWDTIVSRRGRSAVKAKTTTTTNNARIPKSSAIKPPWDNTVWQGISVVKAKTKSSLTISTNGSSKATTLDALPISKTDDRVGDTKPTNNVRLPQSSAIKPPWDNTIWQGRSVVEAKSSHNTTATSRPSQASTLNSLPTSKVDDLVGTNHIMLPKSSAIKPPWDTTLPWQVRSVVEAKSTPTIATSRLSKATTRNSLPILKTNNLVGEKKSINNIRLPKSSAIKPPGETTVL
ncbi:uncharacterized protein [Littorina saxatilis]|uniref:Uncharacterized protein n=1 Tax=Littorina saxatilis TaxID=31220 RepID=A0AAN9BNV9_9CAEN